jgi:hypothetical protein
LYFLSDGAAAILAQEAGSSPSEFDWRRRDNLLSESSTLPHLITLNDVRISLEVDAEQRGVQILIWETERELKARSIKVPREHKGDEQQQEFMALIPDSYFCLYAPLGIVDQNDSYSYAYFLEIDLNTEHAPLNSSDHPPNYFTTKVVKYLNYLASDKPQRQFSFEAIRVLTVTTDSKRLEKLLLATESKGGGQHFWFTTFADIVPIQSALTKPIWWQAGNREKRTLIW